MDKKIAIVTGAAGGIGRSIVGQLIKDNLHVIAFDMNKNGLGNLEKQFLINVHPHLVDLTNYDGIKKAFSIIESEYGGIDVLVNNAGDCFMSEFPEIPSEEFELQMSVNFSSAFYCSQFAVKSMLKRPGIKKIVNISSNGAYNFDVFDPPHYRASKAALDTLTKDLARRYAKAGISVNSIAPP